MASKNKALQDVPFLIQIIALFPLIVFTSRVTDAVICAMALFSVTAITNLVAVPISRRLCENAKNIVFLIVAGLFTAVAEITIVKLCPPVSEDVLMWFPITSVVCAVLSNCDKDCGIVKSYLKNTVSGLQLSLLLIFASVNRELLSTGALFAMEGRAGVGIFADWFNPIEVLSYPAGALIFAGISAATVIKIYDMRKESEKRRAIERAMIIRGEHETLVYDEKKHVIVRRSTLERIERARAEAEQIAMTDYTIDEDSFDFDETDGTVADDKAEVFDYE